MDIQERRMAVTIVESILDRVLVNPDQQYHIKSFIKKYKLTEEVLGQGCTSIVKRAVSRETGESVAVKIIDITNNQALRERTMKEINILRRVAGHKNIIELLDVYETPRKMFLVFELAEGGELFDYMVNTTLPFSEEEARRLMKQV